MSNSGTTLLSLILVAQRGHFIPLHRNVGRVARSIGFRHVGAVDIHCELEIPPDWIRCLNHATTLRTPGIVSLIRKFKLFRLIGEVSRATIQTRKLADSIYDLLKGHATRNASTIVFIDWFNPLHLVAIAIAMRRIKRSSDLDHHFSCWMLIHNAYKWPPLQLLAMRCAVSKIEDCVGATGLKLMTQAGNMTAYFEDYFHRAVTLLPMVPSFPGYDYHARSALGNVIRCWWPGMPREDKGARHIRKIASIADPLRTDTSWIELSVASSLTLSAPPDGVVVQYVNDWLSDEDFRDRMMSTDIVLLPYEGTLYEDSLSNMLVDSIASGSMPVVAPGTQLEKELCQYNLQELSLDWQAPGFWTKIRNLVCNSDIRSKLETMRKDYEQFHSDMGLAAVLKSLHGGSATFNDQTERDCGFPVV